MRAQRQRRLFVGDVQGCREELERLLEKLAFDPASDALHPVGDLVNRGPDSLGTLRLLRALEAEPVLGNHDLHCLRVAAGLRALGERDTLDELLASAEREDLLRWLAALPFVRDLGDLLLVHAGLHPLWKDPVRELAGLDPLRPSPASDFATRARYCDAKGERPPSDWPAPPAPYRPWFDFWPGARADRRTVVFGHWARMGLVVREKLRGLDTGCVWGGKLSAWIAEEDRIVQVDAARAYSAFD